MAKKKPGQKKAPETLREQFRGILKEAGFTPAELRGEIGVRKIGDGAFLGKFLKLVELLGPFLAPFLGLNGKTPVAEATATNADTEFVNEVRNAVSACGLTHDEMTTTASATGIFGVAEKWLKFAMAILPFLKEQLNDEPASQSQEATAAAPKDDDDDDDDESGGEA